MSDSPARPGVLVVDDDPHVRNLLGLALPRFGFTAWLAAGAEEALALSREHRGEVALALLDVVMPGPDGPATLLALGARRVFLKPFPLDELAAELWRLLGRDA